ncbi:MAG: hypothetical protein KAW92_06245 [Candidatus Cloacimonetes bacterium]|nr:hypothetical protein [Candidatus Cloacimonadota bacterium]
MSIVRIAVTKRLILGKVTGKPTTNDYTVMHLTYNQIAEYIKKGYAITNIFNNNGKFHRKKDYFVSADFFALDFDNKEKDIKSEKYTYFSLDELLKGNTKRAVFIMKNAFIIYTTQSHSDRLNKFRALFHLPERVTKVLDYERITKAFHIKFPEADTTCIEAARYFYGSGKSGFVRVLNNRLSQETIKMFIQETQMQKNNDQEFSLIPDVQDITDIENYANSIIEKEFMKLKETTVGDRNNTLNRVCYIISSITNELQQRGHNLNIELIKTKIVNTALDIGLTHEEIEKTINSGWNTGKEIKLNIFKQIKKPKRTHSNYPIAGNFQITKSVYDHLPEPYKVKAELKKNAVITQIGYFKTFKINFSGTLTEQTIEKLLENLDSPKTLLCYFALWRYAGEIGKTSFKNVNMNDIINNIYENKHNKNSQYKQRKQINETIKMLALVSILRERPSKNDKSLKDIEVIHLINDLEINNEKGKTYLSCELPRKLRTIGAYIPNAIFEISGNDKGVFYLTVALLKEINRICKSKKGKNGKYSKPAFSKKPILWDRKKLISICRIYNTNKKNPTRANDLLRKKLTKLKDLDIIKKFSYLPLGDDKKIEIVMSELEKSD